jgi:hypothetical protein
MPSMLAVSLFDLVVIGLIAIGSIRLFLSTYFTHSWFYADWVKVAFRMVGPVGVLDSALHLYLLLHPYRPSDQFAVALNNTRFTANGFVLGLLCLLILSGESWRGFKRRWL